MELELCDESVWSEESEIRGTRTIRKCAYLKMPYQSRN